MLNLPNVFWAKEQGKEDSKGTEEGRRTTSEGQPSPSSTLARVVHGSHLVRLQQPIVIPIPTGRELVQELEEYALVHERAMSKDESAGRGMYVCQTRNFSEKGKTLILILI